MDDESLIHPPLLTYTRVNANPQVGMTTCSVVSPGRGVFFQQNMQGQIEGSFDEAAASYKAGSKQLEHIITMGNVDSIMSFYIVLLVKLVYININLCLKRDQFNQSHRYANC